MRVSFFLLFFETYPCKTKKNDIQKNEHFPASIQTRNKKSPYTLRKKKSHFWKISPTSHTLRFYLTHYNRTRFYQKIIDEITILHRNFVCFSIFFRITICKPNLICQKCVKSDMKYPCKIFFYFSAKSPYIEQILEIKMYIVKYTADFG